MTTPTVENTPQPAPSPILLAQIALARRLLAALDQTSYSVTRYSGRAMFDRYCVGVSLGSVSDLFDLGVAIGETPEGAELAKVLGRLSTDSLGEGIIAYWRGTTWPPDVKERSYRDEEEEVEEDE